MRQLLPEPAEVDPGPAHAHAPRPAPPDRPWVLLNMVASGRLHPESIVGERIALADVPRVMESMGSFGTVGFTTITDFS